MSSTPSLDIAFVRQHFPAFRSIQGHFFDSAAGSFPCEETIHALEDFYRRLKVQPGNEYPASSEGWNCMQSSKARWAEVLGVKPNEIGFGASTSQNTYVLAQAFSELLKPGDEVVITNQDHESNTGAIRKAVLKSGATLREWQVNSDTGLLNIEDLGSLLNSNTRLLCFPHSSNITGQKQDVKTICGMAKAVGAWTLVDGVSYVPHDLPDVAALGADIYVFSLYKVYSVHQGLMVMREDIMDALPPQYHFFKTALDVNDRFVPSGPDHAQIAASGAVLDYVETLSLHHGGPSDLVGAARFVSGLWRQHEAELTAPILAMLGDQQGVRVLGSLEVDEYRCPLISFVSHVDSARDLVHILTDQDVLASASHFYAPRLLEAVGMSPEEGLVRLSMAHYNSQGDVNALLTKLPGLL